MKQEMSVLVSANDESWVTPLDVIKKVKNVLGEIDLDPASSITANTIVGAKSIFTIEDDMLTKDFNCISCFCNPPFGKVNNKSQAGIFAEYVVEQYLKDNFKEGIILLHCRTGYIWFNNLLDRLVSATLKERVRFINPQTMKSGAQAKTAQTLFYLGADPEKFVNEFKDIAYILYPCKELK